MRNSSRPQRASTVVAASTGLHALTMSTADDDLTLGCPEFILDAHRSKLPFD